MTFFIFQLVLGISSFIYFAYLAYIITNPLRLRRKMDKHKKGSAKYEMSRKFYNRDFLGAWGCITFFFTAGVLHDLYEHTYGRSAMSVWLGFAGVFVPLFVGHVLIRRALNK